FLGIKHCAIRHEVAVYLKSPCGHDKKFEHNASDRYFTQYIHGRRPVSASIFMYCRTCFDLTSFWPKLIARSAHKFVLFKQLSAFPYCIALNVCFCLKADIYSPAITESQLIIFLSMASTILLPVIFGLRFGEFELKLCRRG